MKKIISLIYKILLVVWLVGIFIFGGLFVSENSGQMQVALLGLQLPQASIAAYIMLTLILGLLVGSLFTYGLMQRRLFAKKRQLKKARKEADKLKAINTLPEVKGAEVAS